MMVLPWCTGENRYALCNKDELIGIQQTCKPVIMLNEDLTPAELSVDEQAATNLTELARWSRFFGILVLAGIGLFFVLLIVVWNRLPDLMSLPEDIDGYTGGILQVGILVTFLIIAVIAGVLISFLLRAAARIRNGIRTNDQLLFNSGLANLRNYFAMYTVLGIILLFFRVLGLLFIR